MDEGEERKVYVFILEAGVKLGVEEETAATAAVLTHRFFRKVPTDVGTICPYSLATAALYLAGKVQEDFVKIRDAINVAYAALHPHSPSLEVGELYWNVRDGIGSLELLLARTLGFHLSIPHPHLFLSQYLDSLRSWLPRPDWDSAPIARTAKTLLRDSYVSPALPASSQPQLFALACLAASLRSSLFHPSLLRDSYVSPALPASSQPQLFALACLAASLRSSLFHPSLLRDSYVSPALPASSQPQLFALACLAASPRSSLFHPSLLRDSYVIPALPASSQPQLFALACLAASLRIYGLEVPYATSRDETPWWEVLHPQAHFKDLSFLISRIFNHVYQDK